MNNLSRRFFAAGASCVAVGNPGATTLELSEQGITGSRAQLLVGPGRVVFVTWVKRPAAGEPAPAKAAILDPGQVATADGGTCVASTSLRECAPRGYIGVETGLDSTAIVNASSRTDPASGQPVLVVTLSPAGAASLARISTSLAAAAAAGQPENQLAILVDGAMVNNANVQSPLTTGDIQLSGGVTTQAAYAADLVNLINTGHTTPYRVTAQSPL